MQRQMLRARHSLSHEEPTINLTPLIDVVFVILIMFMVIAPLLEMDQVELADASPSASTSPAVQQSSPIAIYVRADNSVWFNQQAVTVKQLTDRLITAKRTHPHAVPQVFQDKKALFGTYQSVKNGVEAAGYERMDLILNPG